MSEEEVRSWYQAFLIFYRDVPFGRIPKKFVRYGVFGMRLITFEEFKRMI